MTDASEALIEVRDLAKTFDVSKPWLMRLLEGLPVQALQAVDGVAFSIRRGETFSLVGESGCGKSSVARMVVGLDRPTRGSVVFDGTDLAALRRRADIAPLRRRMQMIFQDPYASLNPRWRVADVVAEPLNAFGLVGSRLERTEKVAEMLQQVGLSPDDGRKYPHEFSGGQRQRISIARALAANPDFVVCDEPTSALDVSVQAQILNLMKDLQQRFGLTYLFISHDLSVVNHVSSRIGVMYLGRLCEVATARDLFRHPQHPYSRLLLDTIPDVAMAGRARTPVPGEVPDPIDPPPGCAFHPRCPFASERCLQERPEPAQYGHSTVACHAVEERRIPPFSRSNPGR